MKSLRRIATTLVSSFEGVVGKLENHEALVTTAIREAEGASARARAQLNRVHKDGQTLRAKSEDLRQQALAWEERAKQIAAQDQLKALECVRRREQCLQQAHKLEEQATTHTNLERGLREDLASIEGKLASLRQQRNLLRTRASKAEALRAVSGVESSTLGEIDDIFDRWEARIVASECATACVIETQPDPLGAEFAKQEEEKKLLGVLECLCSNDQK
jgi:phage shock protein A